MLRVLLLLLIAVLPASAYSNSFQQLQSELEKQKYASAATTGLSLLRKNPDNARAKFLTAVALQNNNQPSLAKKHYQQLIQSNPELPEPRNNLAMIYLQQGKHDQAVDLLISSLKTHPAYATAWSNLSNLYKGLASEAYRRALSEEKDTSSVVHKIQLTALTHLHSLPESVIASPAQTDSPVQVATIDNPVLKPVIKIPPKAIKTAAIEPDLSDNDLINIVKNWANAWGKKDIKTYLNAYTTNFKGRKASAKQWRQFRSSRIKRPGKISIKLSNINIKSRTTNQVIIDFHQAYNSAKYSDKVAKRLYLTKTGKLWKISRENTLAVL